jgi:hypothetical protein
MFFFHYIYIMNKKFLQYKCYINCNKKDMILCGIYYKNDKKNIRILGHNNYIYTININNNGYFSCNCPFYLENNIKICKHLFYIFFKMFKIFKTWLASDSKIYLNRHTSVNYLKHDDSVLDGKLNEVSYLLLRRKIRSSHFKLLNQKLYELDNFYLRIKADNNDYLGKYKSNIDNFCNICFEEKESKFKCPECKKTYCLNCINKWVKIKETCPSCRYNIQDYKKIINIREMIYHEINI